MTLILQKNKNIGIFFNAKGYIYFNFLKCLKENHHFRILMLLAKKKSFFLWIQGTPCKKIGFNIYFHIFNYSLNSIVKSFDIFEHCQHLINLYKIFIGQGREEKGGIHFYL
jgi:hypothetical protein